MPPKITKKAAPAVPTRPRLARSAKKVTIQDEAETTPELKPKPTKKVVKIVAPKKATVPKKASVPKKQKPVAPKKHVQIAEENIEDPPEEIPQNLPRKQQQRRKQPLKTPRRGLRRNQLLL